MFNKKLTGLMGIVMASVMLFTACTGTSSKKEEKVAVDIFQFKVEAKEALEKAADLYMDTNPNVDINIQTVGGGDDYGASLKAKFASGEEPAIFNVGGPQDVEDWLANLEDLSDQPWVDLAYNGTLDTVTVDDKIYGMPMNQEGYGLIYNKTIFEKAGIDANSIKTFADLEMAVKTLEDKKDELGLKAVFALPAKETWVTGLHLSNVALGNEFNSALDAYHANAVEFLYGDSLKALLDLQTDYAYQPDGTKGSLNSVDYSTQVEEMFSLGQVAIIQQGNWVYQSIHDIDEELTEQIGMLPIPLKGAVEDSIATGVPMYWSLNNNKEDATKAAAKDFLNWLYTSDEGKTLIINEFNFIPTFTGYESDDLQPKDSLAQEVLRYSSEGRTMPWVFMGYPTAWGMDVLGADIQAYLAGVDRKSVV